MLEFVPFSHSEVDYAALLAVRNAYWADRPTTIEFLKFQDEARDKTRFRLQCFVRRSGTNVGYAAIGESSFSHREGKYFVFVELLPGHEDAFEGALDFLISQVAERGYDHLVFWTRSDKKSLIYKFEQQGAQNTQRQPITELDLEAFDPEKWAKAHDAFRASGFTMRTHAEMNAAGFDWRMPHYELELELWKDVPYTDTVTVRPFDQWLKQYEESPDYLAELNFLAFDGDQMIGLSHAFRDLGNPAKLFTGLTGVRREYRRKGIATALKVACLSTCKQMGFRVIETDNEANNPMLDLNVALGFRKVHEWMQFEWKRAECAASS